MLKSINNVDKILVYGETGLKQLENTNLVDNNEIIKIGSLKTDELFNKNKKFDSNVSKNAITLYAFPCDNFQENFNANTYYSQVWQATGLQDCGRIQLIYLQNVKQI